MLLSTPARTAWTIVNVVAAAIFLHLASWSWLEPNLRGDGAARGGDTAVWVFAALPILAVAALANVVWLVFVIRERHKQSHPWPVSTFTVLTAVWISALVVNGLRLNGF